VKLLANENFPLPSVSLLQQQGYDVDSMSTRSPGCSDEQVLALAHREGRILVTFDRDYGMLVYGRRLPCPPAIIFLRFRPSSSTEPAALLKPLLDLNERGLSGFFIVLERDGSRRRPLP
jgi:predicted nuclease of predicted toxin-antitoxin system